MASRWAERIQQALSWARHWALGMRPPSSGTPGAKGEADPVSGYDGAAESGWSSSSFHMVATYSTQGMVQLSSVQLLSRVQLFATPGTAACEASLSITRSLLKLMSIESVMPSNHLILCCPLLLLSSIFPSIRVFSNESVLCIRWPKDWSFSFSITPFNEYLGLISFRISLRIDLLYLLAIQGSLKSLLQHHSSKASILWCSAFFIVQLSHPYMTTGKTIALTRWTFVASNVSAF